LIEKKKRKNLMQSVQLELMARHGNCCCSSGFKAFLIFPFFFLWIGSVNGREVVVCLSFKLLLSASNSGFNLSRGKTGRGRMLLEFQAIIHHDPIAAAGRRRRPPAITINHHHHHHHHQGCSIIAGIQLFFFFQLSERNRARFL
jgi:hypothetical protein